MQAITKLLLATGAAVVVGVIALVYIPPPKWPGKQYEVVILNDLVALVEGNRFEMEPVTYDLSTPREWTRFCGRNRRVCLEMPTAKVERGHKFTAEMWLVPTPIKLPE